MIDVKLTVENNEDSEFINKAYEKYARGWDGVLKLEMGKLRVVPEHPSLLMDQVVEVANNALYTVFCCMKANECDNSPYDKYQWSDEARECLKRAERVINNTSPCSHRQSPTNNDDELPW